jgi:hypothetical protein
MCFIPVTFDPRSVFGKLRVPVKVTVNGYTYRSTIAAMGDRRAFRCGRAIVKPRDWKAVRRSRFAWTSTPTSAKSRRPRI